MTAQDIIIDMHHEGFAATEINSKLKELFKQKAPAYSSITRCIRKLSFNQDVGDDQNQRGRPLDFYNLDKVRGAIENFPNASIRFIAQLTNVSSMSVYRYLTQHLGYVHRKFRWIPHQLSEDQKKNRVAKAKILLDEIEKAKTNNFHFL